MKASMDSLLDKYRELGESDLRNELAEVSVGWSDCIERTAAIVMVCEERGVEPDALRPFRGLRNVLLSIGRGNLDARILATHIGYMGVVRKSVYYSAKWQNMLATDSAFDVFEVAADGSDTRRKLRVGDMSHRQRKQVFGDDGVRPLEEQKLWLQAELARTTAAESKPADIALIRGGLCVHGVKIPLKQLKRFVEALEGQNKKAAAAH